jgi:hypothetical protein
MPVCLTVAGVDGGLASKMISRGLAKALFGTFAQSLIPMHLERERLEALLRTPLCLKLKKVIPSYMDVLQELFSTEAPSLSGSAQSPAASPATAGSAGDGALGPAQLEQLSFHSLLESSMFRELATACDRKSGHMAGRSELIWQGWWAGITTELLARAQEFTRIPLTVDGDVVDDSIAVALKRRDYLLLYESTVLVAGEHKSDKEQLPINDLLQKHKGSNASLYGKLGYILLYACSGPLIQFYALPINSGGEAQTVQPQPLTGVQ